MDSGSRADARVRNDRSYYAASLIASPLKICRTASRRQIDVGLLERFARGETP
jgi:hypothetical protein